MRREDVDRAPFLPDRIGDLRLNVPAGRPQASRHGPSNRGVIRIEQSIQLGATPPWLDHQPTLDGAEERSKGLHRDAAEVTPLDVRDERLRAGSAIRQVDLPPAPASPEGSEHQSDGSIVHDDEDEPRRSPGDHPSAIRHRPPDMAVLATRRICVGPAVEMGIVHGDEPLHQPPH